MDYPQFGVALATAALIYVLYEQTDNNTVPRSAAHAHMAATLKGDLRKLVDEYYDRYIYPHEYPKHRLLIPASKSYTYEKHTIHIAINDPITGELFDHNTLMRVGAHEYAHLLCRVEEDEPHGAVFIEILSRLDELGAELKLYDPTQDIARSYQQACS